MVLSFITKQIAKDIACIVLIQTEGSDYDYERFIYLAVRGDKMKDFFGAHRQGNYRPKDYGIILKHGYGRPTRAIQKEMKDEYNFDHDSIMVNYTDVA